MSGQLPTADEVLLRQIHPSFFDKGEPSSQPFCPTPKDENKLSVDRSSLTTAQSSFELHTVAKGLASAAVYGLTVDEFQQQSIGCISDPIAATESTPENLAHAYADYNPHKPSAQKNIAKRLKQAAIKRGCLYSPHHSASENAQI
ncbi:hypothetical protein [Methylobacterium ajmalii]|uniref:hypothetical protein n=1 Tax=Methylobacterium ajmalii TaxID=2738439 RepID=UPI002F305BC1